MCAQALCRGISEACSKKQDSDVSRLQCSVVLAVQDFGNLGEAPVLCTSIGVCRLFCEIWQVAKTDGNDEWKNLQDLEQVFVKLCCFDKFAQLFSRTCSSMRHSTWIRLR